MKKPSAHVFSIVLLIFVVATQECMLLFNWYSSGLREEMPWYSQLPSSIKALMNTGGKAIENASNFVHDDDSVELVIGIRGSDAECYPEIENIAVQKDGSIRSHMFAENDLRSVVVAVPLDQVSSFLVEVNDRSPVRYVEPNWRFHVDAILNDLEWEKQWGLKKIEADLAWNTQTGDNSVLVAIVDTGVDYNHADLARNYVALGYDWVNDDQYPMDDHGHGTHCAGIVGAVMNNSVGVAGVAQVKIMAEKGFSADGWGSVDGLAKAIIHATDMGARIISCSWGSEVDSDLIHEAVRYAYNEGSLVVVAAGNSGSSKKYYPAAYEEVVAVTATDSGDLPASFTTFGGWVDLAAPGVAIYSTYPQNQYRFLSGTSMACPCVAGVAALVLSEFPSMRVEQLCAQLLYTADDLGAAGFDVYYGYGRVNARKAVECTLSLVGSKLFCAPANSVYFVYVAPSDFSRPEAAYDAVAAGMIFGLSAKAQRQGFTTKRGWLLESGRVNSTAIEDSVVVFVGGPCVHRSVGFYEDGEFTPVRFASNDTHYMFVGRDGGSVAALAKDVVSSGHEDMLVVELFEDGGNFVLVVYGFDWRGTWAGGVYFKEVLSKCLNDYSGNCYVFRWVDGGELDGVPQSSEVGLVYAAS